jgi:hypothetical protein
MAFRRFLRGNVPWHQLEGIAREVLDRYGIEAARVEFVDADNWLSTPFVVDDSLFVKVVTPQNSLVHALFTTGRNLGAFTSGTEGFFEHFGTPLQMAEHELAATERMRELGVNAPEPLEAFEYEELGVLVLEYLAAFETFEELGSEAGRHAPALFDSLSRMHGAHLAHGDLRAENVLVIDDDLYFIDATSVREGAIDDARAYDVACALAVLEPLTGANAAVDAATGAYDDAALVAASDFLDFVSMRPDHDFDAAALKGEISKQVSARSP